MGLLEQHYSETTPETGAAAGVPSPTALSLDAVCLGKYHPTPGVMGATQNSNMMWQSLDTSHILLTQHSCFEEQSLSRAEGKEEEVWGLGPVPVVAAMECSKEIARFATQAVIVCRAPTSPLSGERGPGC